jgi:hypothetical protein
MKTEQAIIKPTDLRVGNILNYDTAEGETMTTVVDWQDIKWASEDPEGFNLVHSPVPLTGEWLLKFGFWQCEDTSYRWYKAHNQDMGYITIDIDDHTIMIGDSWDFKETKYVHQLQNLFHSLTQTELCLSDSH